jgi:two-component system OmpR family sensor kinase
MFRNLNIRLLISYVLVILVCLALVGLWLVVFLRASPLWTSLVTLRLEAAARATLPTLRSAADSPETLPDLLAEAAEKQEVRTLLVDNKNVVRFDSEGAWTGERLEEFNRTSLAQDRIQGTFTAPKGSRWVFVGRVVPATDGGRQLALFVAPRLAVLVWFADNLLQPLAQAGAVALVLSILLALLISRSISKPLRRVSSAAEAIARGETGARAPVSGPSEVRALAHSFNQMADRVEAARQSQRDFVANVSHELKTPLTSIQGFSQALLDGAAATPEAAARAARVIHEETERMRRLVDDLLILARFDAGQMTLARDQIDLSALLRECVEKLAPQAQAAQAALTLDAPEQLAIIGDRDRLAQVFTNLLDNGLAHTPAGGKVAIAARLLPEQNTIAVTVTDSGEGIPPEALPRIFERFYQVDKARSRDRKRAHERGRGAGLGLAISKEIVEAHGGSIVAESVVGLGSKFTVYLKTSEAV